MSSPQFDSGPTSNDLLENLVAEHAPEEAPAIRNPTSKYDTHNITLKQVLQLK